MEIAQAASSRYMSMTLPFWIAVVVVSLLPLRWAQTEGHRAVGLPVPLSVLWFTDSSISRA
jgi:hypothetical protein